MQTIETLTPSHTEKPWFSKAPLAEQIAPASKDATGKPIYKGEGYLMRADWKQLKSILFSLAEENPNIDATFIVNVYSFAKDAHKNQKRKKDKRVPYIVHPTRCAIRALTYLPDVTDLQVAGLLLHDVVEDSGKTENDFLRYFRDQKGYSDEIIKKLFKESNALSRRTSSGDMRPSRYRRQILRVHANDINLQLTTAKPIDTFDNFLDDLIYDHDHPGRQAIEGLKHYLPKALQSYELALNHGGYPYIVHMLDQAIKLAQPKVLSLRRPRQI